LSKIKAHAADPDGPDSLSTAEFDTIFDTLSGLTYPNSAIPPEDCALMLTNFCLVVSPSSDQLSSKLCQFICTLSCKQAIAYRADELSSILKFLIGYTGSCSTWFVQESLKALGFVLYENSQRCTEHWGALLDLLIPCLATTAVDLEAKFAAMNCLGNLLMKLKEGTLENKQSLAISVCLVANIKQHSQVPVMEDAGVEQEILIKLLSKSLRALGYIIAAGSFIRSSETGRGHLIDELTPIIRQLLVHGGKGDVEVQVRIQSINCLVAMYAQHSSSSSSVQSPFFPSKEEVVSIIQQVSTGQQEELGELPSLVRPLVLDPVPKVRAAAAAGLAQAFAVYGESGSKSKSGIEASGDADGDGENAAANDGGGSGSSYNSTAPVQQLYRVLLLAMSMERDAGALTQLLRAAGALVHAAPPMEDRGQPWTHVQSPMPSVDTAANVALVPESIVVVRLVMELRCLVLLCPCTSVRTAAATLLADLFSAIRMFGWMDAYLQAHETEEGAKWERAELTRQERAVDRLLRFGFDERAADGARGEAADDTNSNASSLPRAGEDEGGWQPVGKGVEKGGSSGSRITPSSSACGAAAQGAWGGGAPTLSSLAMLDSQMKGGKSFASVTSPTGSVSSVRSTSSMRSMRARGALEGDLQLETVQDRRTLRLAFTSYCAAQAVTPKVDRKEAAVVEVEQDQKEQGWRRRHTILDQQTQQYGEYTLLRQLFAMLTSSAGGAGSGGAVGRIAPRGDQDRNWRTPPVSPAHAAAVPPPADGARTMWRASPPASPNVGGGRKPLGKQAPPITPTRGKGPAPLQQVPPLAAATRLELLGLLSQLAKQQPRAVCRYWKQFSQLLLATSRSYDDTERLQGMKVLEAFLGQTAEARGGSGEGGAENQCDSEVGRGAMAGLAGGVTFLCATMLGGFTDKSQLVRAAACTAYASLSAADWRAMDPPGQSACLRMFVGAVSDRSTTVRTAACRMIGSLGLLPRLKAPPSEFVERSTDAMMRVLDDSNVNVRSKAVWALANIFNISLLVTQPQVQPQPDAEGGAGGAQKASEKDDEGGGGVWGVMSKFKDKGPVESDEKGNTGAKTLRRASPTKTKGGATNATNAFSALNGSDTESEESKDENGNEEESNEVAREEERNEVAREEERNEKPRPCLPIPRRKLLLLIEKMLDRCDDADKVASNAVRALGCFCTWLHPMVGVHFLRERSA
jgi:hypothetical protein